MVISNKVIHLFVGPHSVLIRLWPAVCWPWRNNTHRPSRERKHNNNKEQSEETWLITILNKRKQKNSRLFVYSIWI